MFLNLLFMFTVHHINVADFLYIDFISCYIAELVCSALCVCVCVCNILGSLYKLSSASKYFKFLLSNLNAFYSFSFLIERGSSTRNTVVRDQEKKRVQ